MNEMKLLEKQLRSWTPRRPSAELKRRLFGSPARQPHSAALLSWLMPATASILFACVVLNQQSATDFSGVSRGEPTVGMIMSNQGLAAYLPGSFQRTANRLDTFEWTNDNSYTSSIGSLSPARAND